MRNLILSGCCAVLLSGCASEPLATQGREGAQPVPRLLPKSAPPEQDRAAILAMAGEYDVRFAFDETVVLMPGYERGEPKRSGAAELVVIVEDTPQRIVLQHLLLAGGSVVKHWRQDWVWQAETRLEFVANQTWKTVPLDPAETTGRWTQCVYEVSDAPRYCGTGAWNHRYGQPTWTSDRTWRPLPRREYTTRDDYTALNVENRHTLTPTGWTHEQDNSKVQRDAEGAGAVIVREFGFNDYRRTEAVDFSAAYAYWEKTEDYWAQVRSAWQSHFAQGTVVLATEVDGMPIIEGLFALAEEHIESGLPIAQARVDGVFSAYVRTVP